ncbi:MAG: MATE family efflux transporter [Bacteroides sp.]|nr:MATE family efflux transporter [Bacteroides sp.]MCM1379280.1 MATE family efflux transporter [Bacteroides sp.]MCM1445062.1 MATE family efflux transporter [Prevotella sp.]
MNKQILALAIPAIVSNITTPLLSLVDIAIVGHLGSAAFVAAIAVGGTLFNMLYWLFGFLRFGTSGLTAQAYGRGDDAGRVAVGRQSLKIALLLGLGLILLQWPLGALAMWFLDPEPETERLALLYFRILIWGAPAVMMQYALTGWFVGNQNTRVPMWISLAINVINIAASLVLVFVFDLSLRGVAFGTLIAQYCGLLIAVTVSATAPLRHCATAHSATLTLRHFATINADIFLRTVCLIAVTVWFTRSGAAQGTVILAVNTLLLQLFTLFSYFMDGFAFAAEALCGKYVGARDRRGLLRSIRRIEMWGAAMALLFTAIYAIGGEGFLKLLTDDGAILAASEPYRLWAVGIPLAGFMAFTWDGVAIGTTGTRLMLLSMAAATTLFFTLWALLTPSLANHALWIAFLCYLLARGILLPLLIRHSKITQFND